MQCKYIKSFVMGLGISAPSGAFYEDIVLSDALIKVH